MKEKYTQPEIFTIPWVIDSHGQSDLSLSRVSVVYKIKGLVTIAENIFIQRFHVWVRLQDRVPYKLGVYFSLAEAKFRVYDHILYFGIYEYGEWTPQSRRNRI